MPVYTCVHVCIRICTYVCVIKPPEIILMAARAESHSSTVPVRRM